MLHVVQISCAVDGESAQALRPALLPHMLCRWASGTATSKGRGNPRSCKKPAATPAPAGHVAMCVHIMNPKVCGPDLWIPTKDFVSSVAPPIWAAWIHPLAGGAHMHTHAHTKATARRNVERCNVGRCLRAATAKAARKPLNPCSYDRPVASALIGCGASLQHVQKRSRPVRSKDNKPGCVYMASGMHRNFPTVCATILCSGQGSCAEPADAQKGRSVTKRNLYPEPQ